MPVRSLPITEAAPRVLLEGIVDYAGVFPPASLELPAAVRNFAHYRAGGDGWMLGRFVCPASSLDAFSTHAEMFLPRDAGAIPWRLSVTGSGDANADHEAIAAFNLRHRVCFDECSAIVDTYECRINAPEDAATISDIFDDAMAVYFEVPVAADPGSLLDAVAATGRRAKIRTGGVVESAFPSAQSVALFLRRCKERSVVSKATAGLHHVLCGKQPLTYAPNSEVAPMFGFLNVFLAAGIVASGANDEHVISILNEGDSSSFSITDDSISWRRDNYEHVFNRSALADLRNKSLVSFGSCSFVEPVSESRKLGLL